MRIALISDIHSNLPALDAVLAAAGEVDAIWHLGDVVGYGPDPDGVVARLQELGAVGVRGNHDAAAVGGSEIDWFNPDARRAMEWTRSTISEATLAWLTALPKRRRETGCDLVHGSPREPLWEYITTSAVARENLTFMGATISLCLHGHTHVPVAWLEDGKGVELVRGKRGRRLELDGRRALLNPGSVGQPRDGDPDASFAILDLEAGAFEWHRAPYDIRAVQAAMKAAGLPGSLASRLGAGL
ncbi:MAG TPA: metallophosphoesterase family protein [Candidatus Limnocylindrales bacterium]|nr:metallophosphoesterase family protein [Candidatus Limnocylindrales bacterium]